MYALAFEENAAVARLQQADENFDGGALPRPIGTQIAENLTRAYRETDVLNRWDAVVALGERLSFEHGR